MQKLTTAIAIFLTSSPLLAAVQEGAASAPVETVDTTYVVIFGLVFIGFLAGLGVYLWKTSKDDSSE